MKQKRLKILFILLTAIAVNTAGFAVTPAQNISLIENHIFGYENSKMNEKERLSQIEKFVYGAPQPGSQSTAQRIKKLNEDLGLAPDEKEKVAAAASSNHGYNPSGQNTQSYDNQRVFDDETEDYANEPADPTAQYPIVDNIENSLLKKTYTTENIYKRLDRLEKQAYGKTLKGSLSERVDRLSTLVKPLPKKDDTVNNYFADNDDYNYFSPDTNGNPRSTGPVYIEGSQPSAISSSKIAMLEQEVFGRTYPQDTAKQRISRLEKEMLHKEFAAEPDDLRLDRLTTVTNAQKSSSVYKENKLMQHLATGVQIGSMILMILAMIL